MTDYPRFERVQGGADNAHLHYHGGQLVQALLHFVNCSAVTHDPSHKICKRYGEHVRLATGGADKHEKLGIVRRVLRGLPRLPVAVLSAPKGDQGGWEGGARGL